MSTIEQLGISQKKHSALETSRYWKIKSNPILYEELKKRKREQWAKRRDNGFKPIRIKIIDEFSCLPISPSMKWKLRNPVKTQISRQIYYQKLKQDPIRFSRFKQQVRLSKIKTKPDKRNRLEVLSVMGGQCIRCHFNDFRALQIDHVNGDGASERRKFNFSCGANKKRILAGFREGRYQILCANCQWIKRHENNEHGVKGQCQQ